MDPLSVTASIIAVLQLTSTVTSYLHDTRNATAEQAKVAVEAANLYSLLIALRFRVETAQSNDPWFNHVKLLAVSNGPLEQFKEALESLVKELQPSENRARDHIKSALRWTFTKKEVENALRRIERLKSLINCALTNDLITLTRTIRDDVGSVQEQNKRIQDRVDETYDHVDRIHGGLDQLHGGVSQIQDGVGQIQSGMERLQNLAQSALQYKISSWLKIPDPSTNYHAALRKRHPDTGQWLLDGQEFADWRNSAPSLLWLHGSPGCGKTILSTASLQQILQTKEIDSSIAVSYFYFDFNDAEKQSAQKAIRSLLFQFALQLGNLAQQLERLYHKCDDGQRQPTDDAIHLLFKESMARPGDKYIVLDAMDECTEREGLLTFIGELLAPTSQNLRILATSRREKDIEDELNPIANYEVNIQNSVVDADIRIYVRDQMTTDPKLRKWPEPVRNEIMTVLSKKASGMFRWVFCQLESIRKCINKKALDKTLSSLPKTLDETYERILRDLESTDQLEYAIKALRWLCFSMRPLSLAEMVEILAIETGDQGGFDPEDRLPDPMDIRVVCSSLIDLEHGKDDNMNYAYSISIADMGPDTLTSYRGAESPDKILIRLAHFSVEEFLLSDRCAFSLDFQPQLCHSLIAESCLRYLFCVFQKAPLTEELIAQYPLSIFAAFSWWRHLHDAPTTIEAICSKLAMRLLTAEDGSLGSWIQLCSPERLWTGFVPLDAVGEIAQPLYYASVIGVPAIVEEILRRNVDINARGGEYETALGAAIRTGHEKVLRILVDAGANVNSVPGERDAPLEMAIEYGNETMLRILMDANADLNTSCRLPPGRWDTPLMMAVDRNKETMVKMLMDAGADVNMGNAWRIVPLTKAIERKNETIFRLLMDAGANVNVVDDERYTPLDEAIKGRQETMVQILLDAGANVNPERKINGPIPSPLQIAARYPTDDLKIMQLLLHAGADVNAPAIDYVSGTALYEALANRHEAAVRKLLDAGADANAPPTRKSGTALQKASQQGHTGIVRMLLDAGADVNAPEVHDTYVVRGSRIRGSQVKWGTALQLASRHGHETIVRLLLDAGVDVNAPGSSMEMRDRYCKCGTALQEALKHGHETVVQILREAGAIEIALSEDEDDAMGDDTDDDDDEASDEVEHEVRDEAEDEEMCL